MYQNATAFFSFDPGNVITLTNVAGSPFDVSRLLVGPTVFTATLFPSVDVTFVGNFAGGGALTNFFPGLTTGTYVTFSFDVTVVAGPAPIPEPATVLLFGAGLAGAAMARRRRAGHGELKLPSRERR